MPRQSHGERSSADWVSVLRHALKRLQLATPSAATNSSFCLDQLSPQFGSLYLSAWIEAGVSTQVI